MSPPVYRTATRKLLSYAIGRRWQTFIGVPHTLLSERTRTVLDDLGMAYRCVDGSVSTGETVLFGAEDVSEFDVSGGEFSIRCLPVTYDPIQRVVLGIALSSNTLDEYRNAASLIQISPITAETEPVVAAFLQQLAASMESDPWEIDHPRFNRSPLLRYKVRTLWRYWLNAERVKETRTNAGNGSQSRPPDRETR